MKTYNIDDVVWVIKNTVEAEARNDSLPLDNLGWRVFLVIG